jgi:hypothetical protein
MIRRLTSLILGVPDSLGISRRVALLELGGLAVFMAVVAVALFWLLGKQEQTARHGATQFAAAVVNNDPGAAPGGAGDYVRGVRAHFGPVTNARVIGAHNKAVGEEPNTRTFFVAELLLRTKRGPAVVELEFDNHNLLGSEKVSGLYELEPKDAPDLAAKVRRRLEVAYAARGGKPADELTLSGAGSPLQPTPPVHVRRFPRQAGAATARTVRAPKQLRCVQRAGGDVGKLLKCARS